MFAGFRNDFWNVWLVSAKDGIEQQFSGITTPNRYVRYPAWPHFVVQVVFEYAEMTDNI